MRLSFRRSSHLATFVAFDPSRWLVEITLEPRLHTVQMSVHTDGQVVTPRERRYFEAFFEEILSIISPDEQPAPGGLSIWGEQSLSRRAAREALNENVTVTVALFFSFPVLIVLLHGAVAVPMFWAIPWAFVASLAIAYAWMFSARNRAERQTVPLSTDFMARPRLPG